MRHILAGRGLATSANSDRNKGIHLVHNLALAAVSRAIWNMLDKGLLFETISFPQRDDCSLKVICAGPMQ